MTVGKLINRAKRLPSWMVGSVYQTIASLKPPRRFNGADQNTALVLVPGAFCPSSVMNLLGEKLSARGFRVALPDNFPYYIGPVANLCHLTDAAGILIRSVLKLRHEGVEQVWLVGHSNGGLISLLALDMCASHGLPEFKQMVKGVITMATPFKGTDVAALFKYVVPCCRDIAPDAEILERIAGLKGHVKLSLRSTGDFLVPPENQVPDGITPIEMEGYNHTDFIVGNVARVERTADLIKEFIHEH